MNNLMLTEYKNPLEIEDAKQTILLMRTFAERYFYDKDDYEVYGDLFEHTEFIVANDEDKLEYNFKKYENYYLIIPRKRTVDLDKTNGIKIKDHTIFRYKYFGNFVDKNEIVIGELNDDNNDEYVIIYLYVSSETNTIYFKDRDDEIEALGDSLDNVNIDDCKEAYFQILYSILIPGFKLHQDEYETDIDYEKIARDYYDNPNILTTDDLGKEIVNDSDEYKLYNIFGLVDDKKKLVEGSVDDSVDGYSALQPLMPLDSRFFFNDLTRKFYPQVSMFALIPPKGKVTFNDKGEDDWIEKKSEIIFPAWDIKWLQDDPKNDIEDADFDKIAIFYSLQMNGTYVKDRDIKWNKKDLDTYYDPIKPDDKGLLLFDNEENNGKDKYAHGFVSADDYTAADFVLMGFDHYGSENFSVIFEYSDKKFEMKPSNWTGIEEYEALISKVDKDASGKIYFYNSENYTALDFNDSEGKAGILLGKIDDWLNKPDDSGIVKLKDNDKVFKTDKKFIFMVDLEAGSEYITEIIGGSEMLYVMYFDDNFIGLNNTDGHIYAGQNSKGQKQELKIPDNAKYVFLMDSLKNITDAIKFTKKG